MATGKSTRAIEILRYDARYRDQSMEVLRKSFFQQEIVCIGSEVNLTPQAQKDLEQLCLDVADGGVSLIARDTDTDTIVGVSFNVLQTPSSPEDGNYFEQFRDTKCTTDSSRALMQYMITMDAKVNLFERFRVDCLLEIMFLATLPSYAGHGIATRLVEESVQLAKQLKCGQVAPTGGDERSGTTPKHQEGASYFEQFRDTKCTTDSSRSVLNYMIAMDAKVNLFERYGVSCFMDIMYLATLPTYSGHGIATRLVEQSVQLARDLKNGTIVLESNDQSPPELISALFSSNISQRVGEKVGFTFIKEVPHSETYATRREHALMFLWQPVWTVDEFATRNHHPKRHGL
uniref:N-acetyltransferase domain-containing protein n=1 Tax=Anopheles coluzzii TaxID=1518534 RepID=A0A8W7PNJ7_ANOCL